MRIFIIFLCWLLVLVHHALGFTKTGHSGWQTPQSSWHLAPLKALQLMNVKIPLQQDPSRYATLLYEVIAKEQLLRWYITKVEGGVCYIDAVFLESATPGAEVNRAQARKL